MGADKYEQALSGQRLQEISDLFNGNESLVLFFFTWLKHNRNATKAYMELHPNATYESAKVLGSKKLIQVNIPVIMQAYDLDYETYFRQLKAGLEATTNGKPDYRTRRLYHKVLGELLGIERKEKEQIFLNTPDYIPPSWFVPRKLE